MRKVILKDFPREVDYHGRGSAAEEPMVCTTLRWREMDSNLYGAFSVKWLF